MCMFFSCWSCCTFGNLFGWSAYLTDMFFSCWPCCTFGILFGWSAFNWWAYNFYDEHVRGSVKLCTFNASSAVFYTTIRKLQLYLEFFLNHARECDSVPRSVALSPSGLRFYVPPGTTAATRFLYRILQLLIYLAECNQNFNK